MCGDGMTAAALVLPMRPRAALPIGSYRCEIIPASTIAIKRDGVEGVALDVKVLEGEFARREVRLRFVSEGPPRVVERDLSILATWAEAVGAAPAANLVGVIKNLWFASASRRVWLILNTRQDHLGLPEIYCGGVNVEGLTPVVNRHQSKAVSE